MPENSSNGTTPAATPGAIANVTDEATGTTVVGEKPPIDLDRYRPEASTGEVHEEMLRSLTSVVVVAAHNAIQFVHLADRYDRDAGTAVRYGHLVDATECLEIAMTHLGLLKSAVAYRLHTEDDRNADPSTEFFGF